MQEIVNLRLVCTCFVLVPVLTASVCVDCFAQAPGTWIGGARRSVVYRRDNHETDRDAKLNTNVICVNEYFGDTLTLGVGGGGSIFVGGVYVPKQKRTFGVIGPGVALGGAVNIRVVAPSCKVSSVSIDTYEGRAAFNGNHELLLTVQINGILISAATLENLDPVTFSLGAALFLGLSYRYTYWSDPTKSGDRKRIRVGIGVLGGVSAQQIETTTVGGTETAAAYPLGGLLEFGVDL